MKKERVSRGYWQNPDNIIEEVRKIMRRNRWKKLPARQVLSEKGYGAIVAAITNNYEDGFHGLRSDLGEKDFRRLTNAWKDFDYAASEAKKLMEKYGFEELPSQTELTRLGYNSFVAAVQSYHSGLPNFRERLGQELLRARPNSWKNLDYVLEKAYEIIKEHDLDSLPTQEGIRKLGYSDFLSGVYRYHGGLGIIRQKLGEDSKRTESKKLKDPEYLMEQIRLVMRKNRLKRFPGTRILRRLGYHGLISAIHRHHGGFNAVREMFGEKPIIQRSANQGEILEQFLKDNSEARDIAYFSLANGYASDVANILVQLWPNRFPSAADLARSLPGAVCGVGHAIVPFQVQTYERVYGRIRTLPKEIRSSVEDLLYQVMCDSYQRSFNLDPRHTIRDIRELAGKNKSMEGLVRRVLRHYEGIYEFNIPGHGSIRRYTGEQKQ